MSNGYCVRGTLDMLVNGKMDIDQAVEIVNMWIEVSARKGYKEGELDGKRSVSKKSHQAMCDMSPENDTMDGLSAVQRGMIHYHRKG